MYFKMSWIQHGMFYDMLRCSEYHGGSENSKFHYAAQQKGKVLQTIFKKLTEIY